jgi:hypothetical protein
MFIIYVHAKFIITSSVIPLDITAELQIKFKMFAQSLCCSAIYKKRSSAIHLFRTILSGTVVGPTSQVHAFSVLLLILRNFKQYEVWVASNGITFIPNFMKIGKFVQALKGRCAQTSW